ncbi:MULTISPECIES: type III polyketide synthase [Microbacterium]|uniref:Predicted naringenin-chalcone synthase n=1 Tax=Microbacterium saccharophilum TaxID=1213358 RepID=A0A7Z7GF66_9MICO|nr:MULTISPECIES: naringenin-chalcone synthase [Microbacterium]SFI49757.1 Predicted naringenin-chalcone synthase [Microbacterium saccharophilum]
MTTSVLSIGTAVPSTRLTQGQVRDLFAAQPGLDRRTQRLIHAAFDAAAIEHRHTVLAGLSGEAPDDDTAMAVVDAAGTLLRPSTGARNTEFIRHAPDLFAGAARSALASAAVDPAQVTHVVTVSCTGLVAPGPDYRLVRDLGLPTTVERYHLGFVGCAAGIPALRTAARICAAQPDAVVLVVCAELCTLHFRSSADPQQIVASSVFADGAAAAVVTAVTSLRGAHWLELERFGTALTDEGETDMVWTVGDAGFEMVLSAEVPRIVGREIRGAVDRFLGDETVDAWAVHPGGRSVLDRVETGLALAPDALTLSREVLRDYGNMSSATILFILRRLLEGAAGGDGDAGAAPDQRIAALAFGPGLTVESALLTRRTAERA